MWIWRRCVEVTLAAGVLGLTGCAADESAGDSAGDSDFGGGGAGGDMRVIDALVDAEVCPPDQIAGPDGCEPLDDPCRAVDALGLACPDRDGDCFVAGPCPGAPTALVDCDDSRADVWPGAPELCDEIDNDCDELADQGFVVGEGCDACGLGKTECSVADPRTTACSTSAGQSEAPPAVPEVCNGLDEDCDGGVDEGCRLDRPAVTRSEPALCGGALLVIEGEGLVRIPLDGGEAEVLDPGPVRWPACEGDVLAWLKPAADRPCSTPEGGPPRCPQARLFARAGDGSTEDLTGLGDLGPPVVSGGVVYWHTVLADGPVLQRRAPGGPIEPLFGGASASDASMRIGDRIAVRAWTGEVPRIEVRGLDGGRDLRVEGPAAAASPPALDENWVVWVVEGVSAAVWAVPLDRPREGFQVTVSGHPRGRPWLDGGRLYWIDTDGLRGFDLGTGRETLVVPGLTDRSQVDVRDGRVVWVADGLHLDEVP